MAHFGIWDWCIVGFVQPIFWTIRIKCVWNLNENTIFINENAFENAFYTISSDDTHSNEASNDPDYNAFFFVIQVMCAILRYKMMN